MWTYAFTCLRQIPKSGLYDKYMFNYKKLPNHFPKRSYHFKFLLDLCENSSCFTDLHSSRYAVVSLCGIYISFVINNAVEIFMSLFFVEFVFKSCEIYFRIHNVLINKVFYNTEEITCQSVQPKFGIQ